MPEHYSVWSAIITSMSRQQDLNNARDQFLLLTDITLKFSDIHRTMLYPDGHLENDAEHSFHLALVAVEIAANYYPELDTGLISQFSIVHDLPEIHAGDVPTFTASAQTLKQKEIDEKVALEKLLAELPPHTAMLLKRYEEQVELEARFVRLIDKILPAAIHALATEVNKDYFFEKFNISSLDDIDKASEAYLSKLQKMFPEFDFLLLLRAIIAKTATERFFPNTDTLKDARDI